jgi:hypothetical protein
LFCFALLQVYTDRFIAVHEAVLFLQLIDSMQAQDSHAIIKHFVNGFSVEDTFFAVYYFSTTSQRVDYLFQAKEICSQL